MNGLRTRMIDFTMLAILGSVFYVVFFFDAVKMDKVIGEWSVPASVLQLNTIFLSIVIEAVPFVLLGVLIAGMIQIFVTEEHIRRLMPKNRFLAVLASCVIGGLFPACECGIVPIVRRLLAKGVPLHAGIGFLLTGPLINPIVIFSTYMAFGNDARIAWTRMLLGFIVAFIAASIVSVVFRRNELKTGAVPISTAHSTAAAAPLRQRFELMLKHSIDEFFDMGKFLMMGAFFAAFVQTYVSTKSLLAIGEGVASSTIVMMGLAYLLSLCSEADAFIGASFRNVFPMTAILGFLVFGPMLDLKNTFMMLGVFRARFVFALIGIIAITVFASVMLVHVWL